MIYNLFRCPSKYLTAYKLCRRLKGSDAMGFNETMKALADPTRRAILNLLKEGSLPAGEIAEKFDMTGATISHHLSILKKAGLVSETRKKNFIYYTLNASVLEEILLWINGLKGEDENG